MNYHDMNRLKLQVRAILLDPPADAILAGILDELGLETRTGPLQGVTDAEGWEVAGHGATGAGESLYDALDEWWTDSHSIRFPGPRLAAPLASLPDLVAALVARTEEERLDAFIASTSDPHMREFLTGCKAASIRHHLAYTLDELEDLRALADELPELAASIRDRALGEIQAFESAMERRD